MIDWLWVLMTPTGAVLPNAHFASEPDCQAVVIEIELRNPTSRKGFWICRQMPAEVNTRRIANSAEPARCTDLRCVLKTQAAITLYLSSGGRNGDSK